MKKLFLLLLLLLLTPRLSHALVVSHPVIELESDPGQVITKTVRLENETNQPLTFYSVIYNFRSNNIDGKPDLTPIPPEGEVDLASWVKTEPGPIVLQPRQHYEVDIVIDIPFNADPGGHYAAVMWGNEPQRDVNNTNVAIGWKTGHLILLRVAGEIKESGRLKIFDTKDGQHVFDRLPVIFKSEFVNAGNVHLKPLGQIEIKNIFGQVSAVAVFNKSGGNVLPHSTRFFEDVWTKNGQDYGSGFFNGLKSELNNLAFGRYKAVANIVFGNNQEQDRAEVVFWVLPWRLMIVVGLILGLIIWLLSILIKGYNKRIIARAMKQMETMKGKKIISKKKT